MVDGGKPGVGPRPTRHLISRRSVMASTRTSAADRQAAGRLGSQPGGLIVPTVRAAGVVAMCMCVVQTSWRDVPWKSMMKSMPVHALSVAHFVCMWHIYLYLSCLPQYYVQILAFPVKQVTPSVSQDFD